MPEAMFTSTPRSPRDLLAVMQKARCGPWTDELKGWRDPHGCAYEDGSRASWHDGGYSAEKSACSQ